MRSFRIATLLVLFCLSAFTVCGQSDYGYPQYRYAAFSELRWDGEQPVIHHEGAWLELLAVNGIAVDTIMKITREEDRDEWRRQFGLNFPWLFLKFMIKDIHHADLTLREPGKVKFFVAEEVEMTQWKWSELAYRNYVLNQRIDRRHSTVIPDSFQWITSRQIPLESIRDISAESSTTLSLRGYKTDVERFEFFYRYGSDVIGPQIPKWLTREQAEADLDQLEFLLEHRYSYLHRGGVDYRTALDAIRAGLGDGITRPDFVLQVQKILGLFGDLHLRVRYDRSQVDLFDSDIHLPFIVAAHNGRLLAIDRERKGLADEKHPYIHSIAGIPIETWRAATREMQSGGVPWMLTQIEVYWWEKFDLVRQRMKIEDSQFEIVLTDERGKSFATIEADMDEYYDLEEEPEHKREIFENGIAYLPIDRMSDNEVFISRIAGFMHKAEDAKGLIIDLRGNVGGRRDALTTLLPFFMDPNGSPEVINIRCSRVDAFDNPHLKEAIIPHETFHPEGSRKWNEAERQAIQKAKQHFKPEFEIDPTQFAQYDYIVVQPEPDNDDYFHFKRPVVILMDSWCYSATDLFLAAFKGREGVTLVGTPSLGGSGRASRQKLFYSQLQLRMPSMASFKPNGELYDGHGVQPDVLAEPSITDLIGSSDSVLDKAIQLILQAK